MYYRVTLSNVDYTINIVTVLGAVYGILDSDHPNLTVPEADLASVLPSLTGLRAAGLISYEALSEISLLKEVVKCATTSPITLADEQTIDTSVDVVEGDRVLVKDQSDDAENGIYNVISGSDWVRSVDFDSGDKFRKGTMIPIASGTSLADELWMVSSDDPHVVGTSDITFVKVNA